MPLFAVSARIKLNYNGTASTGGIVRKNRGKKKHCVGAQC